MHACSPVQSGFGIAVAAAPLNENAMEQQLKEDGMGRCKGNDAKRRFSVEKEDLTAVIIKRKHQSSIRKLLVHPAAV